jgi:hypothetical protein
MLTCPSSRHKRAVRFHSLPFLLVLAACAQSSEIGALPDDVPDPGPSPSQVIAPPEPGEAELPGVKDVVLSAKSVCPGESVQVDVVPAADGYVFAINGMETDSRTLQLGGAPSTRIIHVDAWPAGDRSAIESRQLEVTVRGDCAVAGTPATPLLDASPSLVHPREVQLTVRNPGEVAADSYEWDFGDGTPKQVTTVPAINHTYALEALSWQRGSSLFDVTVVAVGDAGSTRASRTIAIHTPYARQKAQGVLQPPTEREPRWDATTRRVTTSLYNPEPFAVRLSSLELHWQSCEAGKDPAPGARLALDLVLAASRSTELAQALPEAPAGTCGAELRAHGSATTGGQDYAVEVPLHVELARSPARTRPVDDATARVLEELDERGLVPESGVLRDDELALLGRSGLLGEDRPKVSSLAWLSSVPAPGDECAPGTAQVPPQPGWVCSATSQWVRDEPYIANAHVGDLVLSSTCSEVGTMLRALDAPQAFSHVGIMVQHYDAIRHTTATTKRFEHNRAGPVGGAGVVPDVLRFALPGAVTATVDEAYHGMVWHDARFDRDYRVAGFDEDAPFCAGDDSLVYPLVVTGTQGGFEARKRIARAAMDLEAHYRFFAYTEADIALDPEYDMPGVSGPRMVGAQCSSFVWAAARAAGVTLEGALEARDVQLGAKTQAGILDGLYFYGGSERRAAAGRLYATIRNQVSEDGGWPSELIGAPDNWGNQITNCFAFDACELRDKDSRAWRDVRTTGRTVSPSDLLYWDAPYGRSEPIAYRVGTFRRVYTWQAPNGAGTLSVHVRDAQGAAVTGAAVSIGASVHLTNSAGSTVFFPDAGPLDVVATKRINGVLYAGQAVASVVPRGATSITLTLGPPPESLRAVRISGTLRVVDDELIGSETRTSELGQELVLSPATRSKTARFSVCAGGEARGDVELSVSLQNDWSVQVTGSLRLYEGSTCDTDDREDSRSTVVQIPRDLSRTLSLSARSTGVGGGDRAALEVLVRNLRAN